MIRAIVIDCFGVLATDAWLPFKQRYFGHDQTLLDAASDLNKQSDQGIISYESFITQIAEMASMPALQAEQIISNNVANNELFEYLDGLKPRYKIGMLSNAASNWLPELFSQKQIEVFDAVALSHSTGYTKPMPEAYNAIAEQLQVLPAECVLIDDQERCVSGAHEAGMQAILYKDNDQLRADLEPLLSQS